MHLTSLATLLLTHFASQTLAVCYVGAGNGLKYENVGECAEVGSYYDCGRRTTSPYKSYSDPSFLLPPTFLIHGKTAPNGANITFHAGDQDSVVMLFCEDPKKLYWWYLTCTAHESYNWTFPKCVPHVSSVWAVRVKK
ncbi:hypothetical protein FKW77_002935 [Venturia effusa]|uniref:Uncharacterized protein n=1 Tax=Venturia effusa TaxID=50376 RepID=A0A517LGS8_9PEZI|nr:hypothetical protein FKW77_002935 [Venturia effusa]